MGQIRTGLCIGGPYDGQQRVWSEGAYFRVHRLKPNAGSMWDEKPWERTGLEIVHDQVGEYWYKSGQWIWKGWNFIS